MYQKEPDCEACLPVVLRPENELAFRVYSNCRSQLILAGMDGTPIDINIHAVKIVMERYGCWGNWQLFDKVLNVARAEIHETNENRKLERQNKAK